MSTKYSVWGLTEKENSELKRILREDYGLQDKMINGKNKSELIDLICHHQDLVDRPTVPSPSLLGSSGSNKSSGTKKKSGLQKISISTESEFLNANVAFGELCEVKADLSGILVDDPAAIFLDEIINRTGKIIALMFRINGQDVPIIWKYIKSAYVLRP